MQLLCHKQLLILDGVMVGVILLIKLMGNPGSGKPAGVYADFEET